jgi:hypothetical protein
LGTLFFRLRAIAIAIAIAISRFEKGEGALRKKYSFRQVIF